MCIFSVINRKRCHSQNYSMLVLGGQTFVVDNYLICLIILSWRQNKTIFYSQFLWSFTYIRTNTWHLFKFSFFFTSVAKVKKATWKERWKRNAVEIEGLQFQVSILYQNISTPSPHLLSQSSQMKSTKKYTNISTMLCVYCYPKITVTKLYLTYQKLTVTSWRFSSVHSHGPSLLINLTHKKHLYD